MKKLKNDYTQNLGGSTDTEICQSQPTGKPTDWSQSESGIDEDWMKSILTNSKRMTEDEEFRKQVAQRIF